MKLRLSQQEDQEEEERPTSLSLDFFSSLMATQSKRKGTFQILSFNRKRERVFSTKLNDGFFILKVMMVNEAAEQLQKGLIKPLFILQGSIRNHGQGVIVIKEEVKYWEYLKEVGQPVGWKLKKENVNYKGSNFVMWSTQKIQNIHQSQQQPQITNYAFQLSSNKKEPSTKKQIQEDLQPIALINTSLKQASEQTIEAQTQPILQLKIKTPIRQNNEQRFQTILQLLLTDGSSEEEQPQVVKQPSQKKISTNRKKMQQRASNLQFIFNCLSDEEQEIQPQCQFNTNQAIANSLQKDSESDNEYDLMEWINTKKQNKEIQSNKPRAKIIDQAKETNTISFEDLFHGYINSSIVWQVKAIIKCINVEKEIIYGIICDPNYRFPMHAIFINCNQCSQNLQQNQTLIIGKGVLRHSVSQKVNCSNFDIQFDCSTFILQPIQQQESIQMEQPSQNYCPIDKAYDIEQGLVINCFGVLRDFKTFKGKSTTILHYQIVDPLTKWSIVFIQFESVNPQVVKTYLDKPITIFGAAISLYKNKKNLTRKAFTIIKYDWLPLTQQAKEVKAWMQNNSINNLDTELVGYTQVSDLVTIQDEGLTNFYIKKVEILEFKSKFTYRACSKCFKKVEDNRCRNCGFRKLSQIQNRLFLRGQIGDESAIVSVIFSNSLAESMLSQGFAELKKKWLLKNVSAWIDKGNNGNLSIVRIKQFQKDLGGLINQIKRKIL